MDLINRDFGGIDQIYVGSNLKRPVWLIEIGGEMVVSSVQMGLLHFYNCRRNIPKIVSQSLEDAGSL